MLAAAPTQLMVRAPRAHSFALRALLLAVAHSRASCAICGPRHLCLSRMACVALANNIRDVRVGRCIREHSPDMRRRVVFPVASPLPLSRSPWRELGAVFL
eukprot:2125796-Pyramimonas_sp.AAC.1